MRTDPLKVQRLQRDLPTIRVVAGWSVEHLANLLDVSRQTVMNLENLSKSKMTTIQYLAIRSLLDAEVKESGNRTLKTVIEILVDRDDIPESQKDEIRNQVQKVSSSIGPRVGASTRSEKTISALATVLTGMVWTINYLNKKPEKEAES